MFISRIHATEILIGANFRYKGRIVARRTVQTMFSNGFLKTVKKCKETHRLMVEANEISELIKNQNAKQNGNGENGKNISDRPAT